MSNTRNQLGAGSAVWGARLLVNGGASTTDLDTLAKIKAVITSRIGSLSGTPQSQGLYNLVVDSYKSTNMQGAGTYNINYCGLHGYTSTTSGVTITYSTTGLGGSACRWPSWTNYSAVNGALIDFQISVIGHEIGEMISDPWLNAWKAVDGGENMDKCNSYIGAANLVSGTTGPIYNAIIGGRKFLIQTNYDMVTNTCPKVIW